MVPTRVQEVSQMPPERDVELSAWGWDSSWTGERQCVQYGQKR